MKRTKISISNKLRDELKKVYKNNMCCEEIISKLTDGKNYLPPIYDD